MELVAETLRAALEELAASNEQWLAALITQGWAQRYGRPARYDRLPKTKLELAAYVLQVGEDGMRLLRAVHQDDAPPRRRTLSQVQVLRQVWIQQYFYDVNGQLGWRGPKYTKDRLSRRGALRPSESPGAGSPDPASARVPWSSTEIVTPHDAEARFAHRPGKAAWIGYKDHQTETCDAAGPNVIVHVATRTAPEQDISMLEPIHHALARRRLLPAEHLVDAGYVSPAAILRAATGYGVTLLGPLRPITPSRRRPGFDKQDFRIDSEHHTGTCPRGVTSPPWKKTRLDGQPGHSAFFPRAACRACTDRLSCTGNVDGKGRHLILMPRPLQEVQNRARVEQNSRRRTGRPAMQCAQVARPPSPRPSTPTAFATAATADWRRHTSSTSSPPPVPTSSASANASHPAPHHPDPHGRSPRSNGSARTPHARTVVDRAKIANSIRKF